MTVPDLTADEGLDRWRALVASKRRRERWSSRYIVGGVGAFWAVFILGFINTVTANTFLGFVLGAGGLAAGFLPAVVLTGGLLLARRWLSRRAGLAVLGAGRTPARAAFEPHVIAIEAVLGDIDRLAYSPDERRRLESLFDRLAGVHGALMGLGAGVDRDHAYELTGAVQGTMREIIELRRRALGRTVSGALPPGVSATVLSGDAARVPRLVAPALTRLDDLLGRAGQSDRPAVVASARRAQDSAERALAALRVDIGLTLRTRDLLGGLADELDTVLARESAGGLADPGSLLELEERLLRARKAPESPPS
jgi:hypothetical protein